jgi:hypothetical protein
MKTRTVDRIRRDGPKLHRSLVCTHRGAEIEQRPWLICSKKDRTIPVFACAVHGECTLTTRAINQTEKNCLKCEDITPPAEANQ